MLLRILLTYLSIISGIHLMAQGGGERNKPYDPLEIRERKVINWHHLREDDVMWCKRIWRVIDTREKQNQPMQWPLNPLNVILYNSVATGKLKAYINDSFSSFRTPEEFISYFSNKRPEKKLIDPNGDPEDPSNFFVDSISIILSPSDVKKYKIVEEWIFDKKESRMYVRIIGIALLVSPQIEGAEIGEQEWAWLRYRNREPEKDSFDLRTILVNQVVFNRQNMAHPLSYDDWFELRMFSSYIVKESNPYDAAIKEFIDFKDDGVAALIESERIRQELFEREHDLWEY